MEYFHITGDILLADALVEQFSIGTHEYIRWPTMNLIFSGDSSLLRSIDAYGDEELVECIDDRVLAEYSLFECFAGQAIIAVKVD